LTWWDGGGDGPSPQGLFQGLLTGLFLPALAATEPEALPMQRRIAQVMCDALPHFHDGWEVMTQLLDYAAARLGELVQQQLSPPGTMADSPASGTVDGWCEWLRTLLDVGWQSFCCVDWLRVAEKRCPS
jgi:hypothetical protein